MAEEACFGDLLHRIEGGSAGEKDELGYIMGGGIRLGRPGYGVMNVKFLDNNYKRHHG